MLYPELGHEVLDELRAAQLIAYQIDDPLQAKQHVLSVANRLPLDEMIGIDYDTDSKWGVMNRGDVPDDELIVKRARIVLRGEASDFSYVTSRELGLEFFGVVLSNIRLYAGKAWNPYNNNDLPDRRYVVKEAYLPVIALTSWERAG